MSKIQYFNQCHVSLISGQVKEEVGDVTILINNAGVVTGKPFLDIPDHMVERSFLVNALSHFWVSLSLISLSECKNLKQLFSHLSINIAFGCFLLTAGGISPHQAPLYLTWINFYWSCLPPNSQGHL